MKKLYAFDLDGVIIDSLPNMEISWGVVKLNHNIEIPFSEYAKHIGKPFFDILDELGIKEDQQKIKNTYDEASTMSLDNVKIIQLLLKHSMHSKGQVVRLQSVHQKIWQELNMFLHH